MEEKQVKKIKIKSNSGFTMIDLIIALAIITLFAGIIGGIFYSVYKINYQSRATELALSYVVYIMEDIDKISYDEVTNGMEDNYKTRLSMPDNYRLSIDVSNYNEGTDKADLIKNVKLKLVYEFAGNEEQIVINKMKVKEI